MAKYIKAKQVDAKAVKKGKVDGYEVTDGATVTWQEKKAFEASHVKA